MNDKLRYATAEEFYVAINRSMLGDDRKCFLSEYSIDDYENMNHTILMHNGYAGFAIKDGDIVSVFNSKQNPVRQSLDTMIPAAISLGGGEA